MLIEHENVKGLSVATIAQELMLYTEIDFEERLVRCMGSNIY